MSSFCRDGKHTPIETILFSRSSRTPEQLNSFMLLLIFVFKSGKHCIPEISSDSKSKEESEICRRIELMSPWKSWNLTRFRLWKRRRWRWRKGRVRSVMVKVERTRLAMERNEVDTRERDSRNRWSSWSMNRKISSQHSSGISIFLTPLPLQILIGEEDKSKEESSLSSNDHWVPRFLSK